MAVTAASNGAHPNSIADRLIEASIRLLAADGPSALKARTVAAEAGLSTMVVYNHFGGVPELVAAVADRGFQGLEQAFEECGRTDDPVVDLFSLALTTVRYARMNPHLYDAMFGLSTRATYRPASSKGFRQAGHSAAFRSAYRHITEACVRLADSSRVSTGDSAALAGSLWSLIHGYVTLESAGHFTDWDDPVARVLLPMGVTICVGLGDDPDEARASHLTALGRFADLVPR